MSLRNLLSADRGSVPNGQHGHQYFDTGVPPVLALTTEGPINQVSGLLEARYGPKVDVYKNRDFYVVRMDLPGMKESEIKIGVENSFLTVSGRRQPINEAHGLVRSEIIFSEFEQIMHLSDDALIETIDAIYRNGVLEVKIPRHHSSGTRKISVNGQPQQAVAGGRS